MQRSPAPNPAQTSSKRSNEEKGVEPLRFLGSDSMNSMLPLIAEARVSKPFLGMTTKPCIVGSASDEEEMSQELLIFCGDGFSFGFLRLGEY